MPGPTRGRSHYRPKATSAPMTAYAGKRSATRRAKPGVAAALSFLLPGLGLLFCGRMLWGLLILLGLTPALVALLIFANGYGPGGLRAGIAGVLCVHVGQVLLTHRAAVRMSQPNAR
jgi:hypothetical protein